MSRLEGFQEALNKFLAHTKEVLASKEAASVKNVELFIYGFGLRAKDMEVCDILSLLKYVKENKSVSSKLKTKLRNDMGDSLFSLLRNWGKPLVMSDMMEKASKEIERIGDTTRTASELSEMIPQGENYWDTIADYIYGETPMQKALELIYERFGRELAKPKQADGVRPILCIVSDGLPTDGTSDSIMSYVRRFRERKITIVSCFVTSKNITEPFRLYRVPHQSWKEEEGATLLFNMSSFIPSDYVTSLIEDGWKGPSGDEALDNEARLFIQVNHSSILDKFLTDSLLPKERFS